MKRSLRLSQCMIVKDEEKNIRRALSWAKGIAFEQIVVDTGSTDRTADIAREMGAIVYHYEWNDDFAAAKNYAIEKASGNWIAFLDADEYFTEKDAEKLKRLLENFTTLPDEKKLPDFIRCSWVQLGDDGKPFAVSGQDRIFRNLPSLRYKGRIHEQIAMTDGKKMSYLDMQKELSIMHIGYARQESAEKGKAERNIRLLRREVEENPENYNAWSYLGDSLLGINEYEEGINSYQKALEGEPPFEISKERFFNAGKGLLRLFWLRPDLASSDDEVGRAARCIGYPDAENPDIYYFLALYYTKREDYGRAYTEMERALTCVDTYREADTIYLRGDLERAYGTMAGICQKLGKKQEIVRYAVLSLRLNRYQEEILVEILSLLREEQGESSTADGTWKFLGGLYDLTERRDILFCYKCAKVTGFIALEDRLLEALPEEDREDLQKRNARIVEDLSDPQDNMGIEIRNQVDRGFVKWAGQIRDMSEETLLEEIKDCLAKLKKDSYGNYTRYVDYFGSFPFWGSLDPEKGDYDTLEKRARMLKNHLEDLIWLYNRLEDYRSRETLLAVMRSWTDMELLLLGKVKAWGEQYFDLDLVPSAKDEVFVDVGAYIGDSVMNLLRNYGMVHKKIYAYEADEQNAVFLKRNLGEMPNILIRQKGVGAARGSMLFSKEEEASSSHFERTDSGKRDETQDKDRMTEIVTLDEDIQEPVSWIKMDIEGMEYDALLGCRTHIVNEHPKLSISVYHGYDDLWLLPKLIHSLNPSYKFYLRYYGGNLIPTEIVLTALPGEE
ncbi:MAG TPA: FkbM family methyltransferase [Candidatus Mediterraneibacter norfolkensis]|nr:FkbM family methyltransferase [Candidatus Mediterraneibacter norfolkensis]